MKTFILIIKQGDVKTCLHLHIVELLLIESPWPIVLESIQLVIKFGPSSFHSGKCLLDK